MQGSKSGSNQNMKLLLQFLCFALITHASGLMDDLSKSEIIPKSGNTKPGKPTWEKDGTNFKITWTAPDQGTVQSYKVIVTTKNQETTKIPSTCPENYPDRLSCYVSIFELIEDFGYKVGDSSIACQVHAIYEGGDLQYSQISVIDQIISDPGVPRQPDRMEIPTTTLSGNDLEVKWLNPIANGDAITGYTLEYYTSNYFKIPQEICDTSISNVDRTCKIPMSYIYGIEENGRPLYLQIMAINTKGTSQGLHFQALEIDGSSRTERMKPVQSSIIGDQITLKWIKPSQNAETIKDVKILFRVRTNAAKEFPDVCDGGTGAETSCQFKMSDLVKKVGYYVGDSIVLSAIATNDDGDSPESYLTYSEIKVEGGSPPDPPGTAELSKYEDNLRIKWTVPGNTGGYPIKGYKVEMKNSQNNFVTIDSCSETSTDVKCDIPMKTLLVSPFTLVKGDKIFVQVSTKTEKYTSSPSTENKYPLTEVVVSTAPDKMDKPTVTESETNVVVSWEKPSENGGTINGYSLILKKSGGSDVAVPSDKCNTGAAKTSCTIPMSYFYDTIKMNFNDAISFTMTATNIYGPSEPSDSSNDAVKVKSPPAKMDKPTVTESGSNVVVSWEKPSENGGTINGYSLTLIKSGGSDVAVPSDKCNTGAAQTSCTIPMSYFYDTNKMNFNDAISFTMTATNVYDKSEPSDRSNDPVTVKSTPGKMNAPAATQDKDQVTIAWEIPNANGGTISDVKIQIKDGNESAKEFTSVCDGGTGSTTECTFDMVKLITDVGLNVGDAIVLSAIASNQVGDSTVSEAYTATFRVQTFGTIFHKKYLSCAKCLKGGFEYDYRANGMWGTNNIDSCFSSDDKDAKPSIGKSTYSSANFKDVDYAINACPQLTGNCGNRVVKVFEVGDKETRTADLRKADSCSYTAVSFCGAPTVTTTITGLTKDDIEITTMEYAMNKDMVEDVTAKLSAEKASTTFDFPEFGEVYMKPDDVTASYFATVDLTADSGSLGIYGGKSAATTKMAEDKKAIADLKEEIKKYSTAVDKFIEDSGKYAGSFTDILVEIWDDYIGKPREEGKEEDKANIMTAPSLLKVPTTKLVNPTATDFECGGNPCKAKFSEAGKRAFGVVGKLSGNPKPFDYPVDSVNFFKNAVEPCRPKVMFVNVIKNVIKSGTQTVKFEFESEVTQSYSDLIVPEVKEYTASILGASSIKSFDTFYQENGSSSLMTLATVATATLAYFTLLGF